MNPELKFRAWDSILKGFVFAELRHGTITLALTSHLGRPPISDLLDWQRFTGLKDSKRTPEFPEGQEIYEGDITNLGVVKWYSDLNWDSGGSSHPGFYFKDALNEYHELSYHRGFDNDLLQVIGNIYENPELLDNNEEN